jgi:hypothetical protein
VDGNAQSRMDFVPITQASAGCAGRARP